METAQVDPILQTQTTSQPPLDLKVPTVHVFVRHSAECPHREKGDQFKRCQCRKSLRYTQDGKLRRQSTGWRSWAQAEEAKTELQSKLKAIAYGQPVFQDRKTVRQVADLFLAELEQRGLSQDMPKKFRRMFQRFCDFCAARNVIALSAISADDVIAFREELWKIAKASETRKNEYRRLRSFFRWCHAHAYIDRLPSPFSDGVRLRIKDNREPTKPFEPKELEKILKAVPQVPGFSEMRAAQIRALVLLMRWSLMSIIDATTLARTELEPAGEGYYRIVRRRRKTKVPVNVLIPATVAGELLALPRVSSEYFFWSGEGTARSCSGHFTKYMKKVFEKAGVPDGHPHRLRDTGAVELLKQGVDIRVVQKALGHKSLTTTERFYAPWNKSQQDLMDEKIAAAQRQMLANEAKNKHASAKKW